MTDSPNRRWLNLWNSLSENEVSAPIISQCLISLIEFSDLGPTWEGHFAGGMDNPLWRPLMGKITI